MKSLSREAISSNSYSALIIFSGLIYAAYFVLRFGGLWTENDTAVFTQVTARMLAAHSVLFPGQYSHGFGYPTWLGSLSLLTGLSVPVMNTIVMPFIAMLLFTIAAYIAYRTFLNSDKLAALSVLLIFAIPDVMFTLLRGNHEKLNIVLMLWALVVLFRAFRAVQQGSMRESAVWIGLFYVFVFTNATVNDYFASTFAVAASLTLIGGWILLRLNTPATIQYRPQIVRLGSYVIGSWLLVWWVMLYVFPPAGHDFALAHTALNKIVDLFLTLHTSSNPYSAPASQWAGKLDQILVASFRWVLSVVSIVIWGYALWKMIWRKHTWPFEHLFLLALYGAFGFLVALAIPLDFTGMNAGTNLEVRNFPYYALMASPVLVWGLIPRLDTLKTTWRPWVTTSSAIVLATFVLIGLFKSTLDPVISNQWMFYTPAERQALSAFNHHSRSETIWTGPDNRLVYADMMWHFRNRGDNTVTGFQFSQADRDLLISPEVIASSLVEQKPVPPYLNQNRIYDNGSAQIYRLRPQTPFEN